MSIDIDVGKISEDLNNKADLDMNNTVGHLGTSAKDEEQTPEIIAEIEALKQERTAKVEEIKQKYPYPEE